MDNSLQLTSLTNLLLSINNRFDSIIDDSINRDYNHLKILLKQYSISIELIDDSIIILDTLYDIQIVELSNCNNRNPQTLYNNIICIIYDQDNQ